MATRCEGASVVNEQNADVSVSPARSLQRAAASQNRTGMLFLCRKTVREFSNLAQIAPLQNRYALPEISAFFANSQPRT